MSVSGVSATSAAELAKQAQLDAQAKLASQTTSQTGQADASDKTRHPHPAGSPPPPPSQTASTSATTDSTALLDKIV